MGRSWNRIFLHTYFTLISSQNYRDFCDKTISITYCMQRSNAYRYIEFSWKSFMSSNYSLAYRYNAHDFMPTHCAHTHHFHWNHNCVPRWMNVCLHAIRTWFTIPNVLTFQWENNDRVNENGKIYEQDHYGNKCLCSFILQTVFKSTNVRRKLHILNC